MPAYAPNFTARVRIKYTAIGRQHTQTWRTPAAGAGDTGIAALIVDIGNYYADIQGSLSDDFAILSTTFAREDTDLFLPSILGVTVTPTGGTPAAGFEKRASAQQLSFVGRSSLGGRAIIYQYGFLADTIAGTGSDVADDFRINPGEDSVIDTVTSDLNGVLATICANDGGDVTWFTYANMKYNDNVLKKIRKGA